jgi:hypothetical protein
MALNVRRKFKNRLYEVRLINTLLNLPLWLALWMAGGKQILIFLFNFYSHIQTPPDIFSCIINNKDCLPASLKGKVKYS